MANTDVDPSALEDFATRLRNASSGLDGTDAPPHPPEAEEASGLLAAMLSNTTSHIDEIVNNMSAAGDAVAEGGQVFQEIEANNQRGFDELQPE